MFATNERGSIVVSNSEDTEIETELRNYIVNNLKDIRQLIKAVKQLNKKLEEIKGDKNEN